MPIFPAHTSGPVFVGCGIKPQPGFVVIYKVMRTLYTLVIGFIAGLAGSYVFYRNIAKPETEPPSYQVTSYTPTEPYRPTIVESAGTSSLENVDFSFAATRAIPSVVFINSISQTTNTFSFDWFFGGGGGGSQQRVSSGSGVIFTADGYIVTNNHVVEEAERIEVNYNKKVYAAELIGTDPSTDLAVLKISEKNLPAITLGDSKKLSVGEWVVAVGNPFSLSSTVTAGIVSAKGRRIGILEDRFPIESFIQTDAAINPGNSGGALVNKNGELVGINTAILSRTGSYTGYAFAVPTDIVRKVVEDLIRHGIVQKAFFGGDVLEYNFANAQKYELNTDVQSFHGVVLAKLDENGPAAKAGLKLRDIITKINGVEINSESAFDEILSYGYPGDEIEVTYERNQKPNTVRFQLVNKNGTTTVIKRKIYSDSNLGAQLEATDYGVKVNKIREGGLFKRLGIPENYTIVILNRNRVNDPQKVVDFFNDYKGTVYMNGFTSAKQEMPLRFNLR